MFVEIFSTSCFFLAILHFFFSNFFQKRAHQLRRKRKRHNLAYSTYNFLGNAALIFGLWLLPVFIVMLATSGTLPAYELLKSVDLQEPFAYFVLITLATIRPLRQLFDALFYKMSTLLKHRLLFFWVGILLFSSLLTGLFSEIAIMVLLCFTLSTSFFKLKPSPLLAYSTLTLLLLGISVGTTILPFNFSFFQNILDPNWTHVQTFTLFGWKVFLALFCLCIGVAYLFRKEFQQLQKGFSTTKRVGIITFREWFYGILFFLASLGKGNAYALLLVLGIVIIFHKPFYRIKGEEGQLRLYFPLIIAFFTYTLEIHAVLQKWWVLPLFEKASGVTSYLYAFALTGLNEHVPIEALKETLRTASTNTQFLSYLGVLTGGGLTLIAKSANIVAKLKLRPYFPHHAINPLFHLLLAVPLGLAFSLIIIFLHALGG